MQAGCQEFESPRLHRNQNGPGLRTGSVPRSGVPAQYGEEVPPRRKFPAATPSAAARARYAKRRKRRLAGVDNDLTPKQWADIRDAWGGCAYCQSTGVAVQRDCIQPVSRGGRYTLENVVPACVSCNASKNNGEVTTWLRRKQLDERAFLLRHATILSTLLPEDDSPPL
ncbi:endonuclease [Microbacterium sp. MYb64]|nr:endonuclease [Microbacterium sp. MYb64]